MLTDCVNCSIFDTASFGFTEAFNMEHSYLFHGFLIHPPVLRSLYVNSDWKLPLRALTWVPCAPVTAPLLA